MTKLFGQNRPFAIAIGVWLVGALVFFFAVHLPLSGPAAALEGGGDGGTEELKQYYAKPGTSVPKALPYDAARRQIEARRAKLDAAFAAARQTVLFKPGTLFTFPEGTTQRNVEYATLRRRIVSKLQELANTAGLRIPGELDPRQKSSELPSESEADDLLFRLAMTDRVIRAAVDAAVPRIASLTHRLGPPQGVPLAQRHLTVRLEGGLDQVVRFIEQCSRPMANAEHGGGVLAVRHVELSRADAAQVVADVTLAALSYVEVKAEPIPTPKPDTTPASAGRGF